MKRFVAIVPAALVVAVLSASPARAADPFAEFRIPDHWAQTGRVTLSANTQQSLQQRGNRDEIRSRSGQAATTFDLFRDSEPVFAWLDVSANGLAQWSREQQASIEDIQLSDNHRSTGQERWTLDTGVRLYPWRPPVGLELSAAASEITQQNWSRRDVVVHLGGSRAERRDFERTDAYSFVLQAEAGIPFGRVRDATTVYDIHVIEQRLLEVGAIDGPLPASAREKLAALLVPAQNLDFVHDRPGRFLWREVERVLREEGVLGDRGLDAYAALRLAEPTQPRSRFVRMRGALIGPQVRAVTQHLVQRDDLQIDEQQVLDDGTVVFESHLRPGGARFTSSEDAYWLGAQGQFDRPLGWRWQLDAFGFLGTPIRVGDRGVLGESSVSLGWDVADRWAASARFDQHREFRRSRNEDSFASIGSYWTVQYSASLAYFLEDRTSVSLGWSAYQYRYSQLGAFARYSQASIAISYRFLGALAAPGLMSPAEPVH